MDDVSAVTPAHPAGRVVCETEGCGNKGIEILVGACDEASCGPCGAILYVTPDPEAEKLFPPDPEHLLSETR